MIDFIVDSLTERGVNRGRISSRGARLISAREVLQVINTSLPPFTNLYDPYDTRKRNGFIGEHAKSLS